MKPFLSICIPTYNRAAYLDRCLKSVSANIRSGLKQPVEVIVGDNASPDNTAEVVQQFQRSLENLRYYRNARNIGLIPNYRKIIGAAEGVYLLILTDDDWLVDGGLEKVMAAIEGNPDVGYIFSPVITVDDRTGQICAETKYFPKDTRLPASAETAARYAASGWVLSRQVYKRELLEWDLLDRNIENAYLCIITAGRLLRRAGGFYMATTVVMHTWYNPVFWEHFGEDEFAIRINNSVCKKHCLRVILDGEPECRPLIRRWEWDEMKAYLASDKGGYQLAARFGYWTAVQRIWRKFRPNAMQMISLAVRIARKRASMKLKAMRTRRQAAGKGQ